MGTVEHNMIPRNTGLFTDQGANRINSNIGCTLQVHAQQDHDLAFGVPHSNGGCIHVIADLTAHTLRGSAITCHRYRGLGRNIDTGEAYTELSFIGLCSRRRICFLSASA